MGLYFPRERWTDLERGISLASNDFGFESPERCVQWLLSAPITTTRIDTLANYLAVGETYFFRGQGCFEALREYVLPKLIRSQRQRERRLRIWDAGCSTGEEPYSIAMLLHTMIPDIQEWEVTIIASDMNSRALQKASLGLYPEWSFRAMPVGFREKFFKKTPDWFEILPHIKQMVKFSSLNLVKDGYPSPRNNTHAMDLILCRNVLMYFSSESRKQVISNFYHALGDGGWLIVSPTEASQTLYPQFAMVHFPGAIFFLKDQKQKYKKSEARPPAIPVKTLPSQRSKKKPLVGKKPESAPAFQTHLDEISALYQGESYIKAAKILSEEGEAALDGKAFHLLAHTCLNQGKLEEALQWNEKALTTDGLNFSFHYFRAVILEKKHLPEEAMLALRRTLYLAPDFVLAHFEMGNVSWQQGKNKEANKHFENVRALLKNYESDEILPESDGMTAGQLMDIATSTIRKTR